MVMVGFRRKILSMASTFEDQILKGKQMNINAEGVDDSSEGAHALSQNSYTLKSQELSKGEQMNINTEGVDDSTEGAPALSRSYSLKSQPPRRRPRRRAESTMLLGEEIPLDPLVLIIVLLTLVNLSINIGKP